MIVTMNDVAREAGVSQSTVSLVLNGKVPAQIPSATREKVLSAARRLGYSRNALAVSMKTGRSKVVGLIGGLHSGYTLEMIKGIGARASASGYSLKIIPTEEPGEFAEAVERCAEQRLDGVIAVVPSKDDLELALQRLKPFNVAVVALLDEGACSSVTSDDFAGAKRAVEYLFEIGHRRIAHAKEVEERCQGYIAAMREHGLADPASMIAEADPSAELTDGFRETIGQLLKTTQATAIFCSNDPIAMKVLQFAYEMNIRIPDNLSVIGFAATDYSAFSSPPLTTVKQSFREMGGTAFDILLGHMDGDMEKHVVRMPTDLVVRASVRRIN